MTKLDVFGDGRRTPKLSINVKVKVKTESPEENTIWNNVFGYIIKKPRTKLEFLAINSLRKLPLEMLELSDIKEYLNEEDYAQLIKVERLFNRGLTMDIKAFILAVLKISISKIETLLKNKAKTY